MRRGGKSPAGMRATSSSSEFDPPLTPEEEQGEVVWRRIDAVSVAVVMFIFLGVSLGYAGVFDEGVRNVFRYAVIAQIAFVVLYSVRALSLIWRDRKRLKTNGKEIAMVTFHIVALGAVLNLNSRTLGVLEEPVIQTELGENAPEPQDLKKDLPPGPLLPAGSGSPSPGSSASPKPSASPGGTLPAVP